MNYDEKENNELQNLIHKINDSTTIEKLLNQQNILKIAESIYSAVPDKENVALESAKLIARSHLIAGRIQEIHKQNMRNQEDNSWFYSLNSNSIKILLEAYIERFNLKTNYKALRKEAFNPWLRHEERRQAYESVMKKWTDFYETVIKKWIDFYYMKEFEFFYEQLEDWKYIGLPVKTKPQQEIDIEEFYSHPSNQEYDEFFPNDTIARRMFPYLLANDIWFPEATEEEYENFSNFLLTNQKREFACAVELFEPNKNGFMSSEDYSDINFLIVEDYMKSFHEWIKRSYYFSHQRKKTKSWRADWRRAILFVLWHSIPDMFSIYIHFRKM